MANYSKIPSLDLAGVPKLVEMTVVAKRKFKFSIDSLSSEVKFLVFSEKFRKITSCLHFSCLFTISRQIKTRLKFLTED